MGQRPICALIRSLTSGSLCIIFCPMKTLLLDEDWSILTKFLPKGWQTKAKELGALVRKKKIDSADTLLRLLLIHLADGKSLRTTAAYAKEVNLCDIKDVALIHRLRESGEWLHWMAVELFKSLQSHPLPDTISNRYRIRLVDGSLIRESGTTGTDWRLHYCFQLNNLRCDTFKITSTKTGESLQRYTVKTDDFLIGDRGYCQRKGIVHVLNHQGHVMVRFHSTNLPLFTRKGSPCPVLKHLRSLPDGVSGDWDVWFKDPYNGHLIKGRLCSIRKSKDAIEKAEKQARRTASKHGQKLKPETLEYAKYITLFTTVNRHNFKSEDLLSLYRSRWQIELVFKRLKSIIGIGHLPNRNPRSSISWLYGKMVVALLAESLYQEAEFFSPWGYPI